MNRVSTSRPPTARGQRTRQKLVEAAEGVFGEKGFERTGIQDITREAGVALGTFYVYFPDKQALFVEVVDALGARLRDELKAATEGAADRLEVERRGLEAFFAFAARHRSLYRIVRQAEFVDEECFRRYYRRIAEPYARALGEAMDAGQVRRVDPEVLAYCLMGLADFLGLRYVLWGRGKGADRALEDAVAFVREGMALPGPAAGGGSRKGRTRG